MEDELLKRLTIKQFSKLEGLPERLPETIWFPSPDGKTSANRQTNQQQTLHEVCQNIGGTNIFDRKQIKLKTRSPSPILRKQESHKCYPIESCESTCKFKFPLNLHTSKSTTSNANNYSVPNKLLDSVLSKMQQQQCNRLRPHSPEMLRKNVDKFGNQWPQPYEGEVKALSKNGNKSNLQVNDNLFKNSDNESISDIKSDDGFIQQLPCQYSNSNTCYPVQTNPSRQSFAREVTTLGIQTDASLGNYDKSSLVNDSRSEEHTPQEIQAVKQSTCKKADEYPTHDDLVDILQSRIQVVKQKMPKDTPAQALIDLCGSDSHIASLLTKNIKNGKLAYNASPKNNFRSLKPSEEFNKNAELSYMTQYNNEESKKKFIRLLKKSSEENLTSLKTYATAITYTKPHRLNNYVDYKYNDLHRNLEDTMCGLERYIIGLHYDISEIKRDLSYCSSNSNKSMTSLKKLEHKLSTVKRRYGIYKSRAGLRLSVPFVSSVFGALMQLFLGQIKFFSAFLVGFLCKDYIYTLLNYLK